MGGIVRDDEPRLARIFLDGSPPQPIASEYSVDPVCQLTELPSNFVIGDFDVSPDGTEIIFDREQESSSIVLIERRH